MRIHEMGKRLETVESRILPKPGAEILEAFAEGFKEAYQAARARGSVIIVDDIPRALA
jgi:hypothetical protein